MRLRVTGGQFGIIAAYDPHNEHEYPIRQSVYNELSDLYGKFKVHGVKIIMGDLNARMHNQQVGEDDFLGPHCMGKFNFEVTHWRTVLC